MFAAAGQLKSSLRQTRVRFFVCKTVKISEKDVILTIIQIDQDFLYGGHK